MEALRCCDGLLFVSVPGIGYLRSDIFGCWLVWPVLAFGTLMCLGCAAATRRCPFASVLGMVCLACACARNDPLQGVIDYMVSSRDELMVRTDFMYRQGSQRPPTINTTTVLSKSECAVVYDSVMELRDLWIHVDHLAKFTPFFTLGTYSGYVANDVPFAFPHGSYTVGFTTSLLDFGAAKAVADSALRDRFGWLYSRLLSSAGGVLGGNVRYAASMNTSLPGFHIICSHRAFSLPIFETHLDGYGERLRGFNCEEASRASLTLSVDLSIRQPSAGSGLSYADFNSKRCGHHLDFYEAMKDNCSSVRYHEYREGILVIHDGPLVHAISPWPYSSASDCRVTLQCFAARCKVSDTESEWLLFW
ncbi:unnamed protein product [Symbiodinium sp. CCMP2592]|nr:unnamed protein product [Symbiodinium sp. CCMP2592]